MGVQGVPFRPSKSDLRNAIDEYKGVAVLVAQHFDVTRKTLWEKLKDMPEMREYMDEVRARRPADLVRRSEKVLEDIIANAPDNPALAAKVSMYLLDNHGKESGYNRVIQDTQTAEEKEIVDKGLQAIDELQKAAKSINKEIES